jgi:hypothetical protein
MQGQCEQQSLSDSACSRLSNFSRACSVLQWFGGLDGWYVSRCMSRVESVLAIASGVWALIDPIAFLDSLAQGFHSTAYAKDPALLQVLTLLVRMAANGMILAGLLKWHLLSLTSASSRRARWIFVQAEVLAKFVHLAATSVYMCSLPTGASCTTTSAINLVLSGAQFVAICVAVAVQWQWNREHPQWIDATDRDIPRAPHIATVSAPKSQQAAGPDEGSAMRTRRKIAGRS